MVRRIRRDYSGEPLLTRKEARKQGVSRYFLGAECLRGHIAPRYTRNAKCIVCAADDTLAWQKNQCATNADGFRRANRERRFNDPIGHLFRCAKSRANRKGVPFTITRDDLSLTANCPCCQQKMVMRDTAVAKHGPVSTSPSIDRLNPELGYVPGNVAIICWRCNNLKRDATTEELRTILNWMESIQAKKHTLRIVS